MKNINKKIADVRFFLAGEGFEDATIEHNEGQIEVVINLEGSDMLGNFIRTMYDMFYLEIHSALLLSVDNGVRRYKIVLTD